jgi:hypothetical protein
MTKAVMTTQSNVITLGPDQYIATAIERGSDVATLERLFDLKAKHDAAEAKKAFIRAMQQFQAIKPDLPRSQSVSFGQGKTAYNFCPLSVIEKALRDPLSTCGLSYRFENLNRDGGFGVRCVVTHESGHSESTEMYAPADSTGNKNAIQGIGSTSTYLMRYTLIAAFALTTADEDNDGQTNSDLPYNRLLQHNEVLRDNLKAVLSIKESLSENDYYQAVVVLDNMSEEVRTALWVAPTKGGVFTTEERAKMKSNEFHSARLDYIAEKQQ